MVERAMLTISLFQHDGALTFAIQGTEQIAPAAYTFTIRASRCSWKSQLRDLYVRIEMDRCMTCHYWKRDDIGGLIRDIIHCC